MASLRDKLKARSQPKLEEGEQIRQIFLAQSGPNPNLLFLTSIFFLFNKYRVIAVTDREIVVMRAGMMSQSFPKDVIARLPRQTRLGPTAGALWSKVNLPGMPTTWVHRRFYEDVQAADAGA